MSKEYNAYKWSNCLIEAIKAWIRNPHVEFIFLPAHTKRIPLCHIAWSDGTAEYSFESPNPPKHWWTTLLYYGCIRKHNLGWCNKYCYFIEHMRQHEIPVGMDIPEYSCRFTLTASETKQ